MIDSGTGRVYIQCMAATKKPQAVDPLATAFDPFKVQSQVIKCPVCSASNFEAKSLQWGLIRKCLECGNEWSGGSVARPDPTTKMPHPDAIEDDDDMPLIQYTGAGFRDPGRNFGGDDE